MYIAGQCKVCKKRIAFDIGDMEFHKGLKAIKGMTMSECQGGHMEIGTYGDYYILDENTLYENSDSALREEAI